MSKNSTTLTLSGRDAERLDRIVKSGGYSSPEAAISEALSALEDAASPEMETWLRGTVIERLENPQPVPLKTARQRLLGND
jgi:Arc/MetJ-type ribon-helix-helix transcriptional regulator